MLNRKKAIDIIYFTFRGYTQSRLREIFGEDTQDAAEYLGISMEEIFKIQDRILEQDSIYRSNVLEMAKEGVRSLGLKFGRMNDFRRLVKRILPIKALDNAISKR